MSVQSVQAELTKFFNSLLFCYYFQLSAQQAYVPNVFLNILVNGSFFPNIKGP